MTAVAGLAAWIGAFLVWVGYLGNVNWSSGRLAGAFFFLGAPLLFTVPLLQLPAMRWVSRHALKRPARGVLATIASGLLPLPLVWIPVFLLAGTWPDAFRGEGNHFIILYATFGVLFGLWYSVARIPRPTSPA